MRVGKVFVGVVLVLAVAMSAQATIINACDSLVAFTATPLLAPSDLSIVAGAGPDGSSCLQFVPRDAPYTHSVIWDFADVTVTGSDTLSFDVKNDPDYGVAHLYVWTFLDNGDGTSTIYCPASVNGAALSGNWTHFSVAMPDGWSVQKVQFIIDENIKIVKYDNMVLTPEPATMAMLGLGGLGLLRRKRNA